MKKIFIHIPVTVLLTFIMFSNSSCDNRNNEKTLDSNSIESKPLVKENISKNQTVNTSPPTPTVLDQKYIGTANEDYYNFSKAIINGFELGDILHDAYNKNLDVKMPSFENFQSFIKKSNPTEDNDSIISYYNDICVEYQKYIVGDYNSFLDCKYTWYPNTEINRRDNPDLVGYGTPGQSTHSDRRAMITNAQNELKKKK